MSLPRTLATVMLLAATASTVSPLAAQQFPSAAPDPAIAHAIATISADNVRADIARLVSFRTRSTLSSNLASLSAGEGVLAAAAWLEQEFRDISATCGNCLDVRTDDFIEPAGIGPGSRIPKPTRLVNIYAILKGTAPASANAPWVLVTGHYDSRATDVMDPSLSAPGANDDASGVAVSLECARALVKLSPRPTGTIVFAAVSGEEQGLNGSRHLARLALAEHWPVTAVLNNDIVGGDLSPGLSQLQDPTTVRVFSENVPSTATPDQLKQVLSLGAESDSPSRQVARTIAELASAYFQPAQLQAPSQGTGRPRSQAIRLVPAFHPTLVLRRDRYLRGGDHTSWNAEGFAAVRFTEWRENFDHQHQTPRTEHGTEFIDDLKFVDTAYVARVAQLNATTLASLASAPSPPQRVRILTGGLDNASELVWDAPAFAPAGTTYQVLWRPTDSLLWTNAAAPVSATRLKLDVSKDNVLFGVRALAPNGHASLPVAPLPARQ